MRRMDRLWLHLEEAALWLLRKGLTAASRDITEEVAKRSCLVLAPHPDDETLGCGGIILRKSAAGQQVHIVIATDGMASHSDEPSSGIARARLDEIRRRETVAACEKLGVPANCVEFYALPDGRLNSVVSELEDRIEQSVARWTPEEVFVCAEADGHRDHKTLARTTKALYQRGALANAVLYEYPIWFWDFRSWRAEGRSNKMGYLLGLKHMLRTALQLRPRRVCLETIRETKRAALDAHRSQIGRLPEEAHWSGLPDRFLSHFFAGHEVFFEVRGDKSIARR